VHVTAPAAHAQLVAGAVAAVDWEIPTGVYAGSAALLLSSDGGVTWHLVGDGLPNTGTCDWTVANVPTNHAKLAVVLVESGNGELVEGVLGSSEEFAITGPVGVGDPAARAFALAIEGTRPNPAVGRNLRVRFVLRDASAARLDLIDIAGRTVTSRRVGVLGAGPHELDLADRHPVRAGIYFVRLIQGGREVRARVVLLP
jgi:hypothetical protein